MTENTQENQPNNNLDDEKNTSPSAQDSAQSQSTGDTVNPFLEVYNLPPWIQELRGQPTEKQPSSSLTEGIETPVSSASSAPTEIEDPSSPVSEESNEPDWINNLRQQTASDYQFDTQTTPADPRPSVTKPPVSSSSPSQPPQTSSSTQSSASSASKSEDPDWLKEIKSDSPKPPLSPQNDPNFQTMPAPPHPQSSVTNPKSSTDFARGVSPTRPPASQQPTGPSSGPAYERYDPQQRTVRVDRVSSAKPQQSTVPPRYSVEAKTMPAPRPPKKQNFSWRRLIKRSIITLLILFIIGFIIAAGGGFISYTYLAAQLPSPSELKSRQFNFRTTTITDRNGNVLWEITDPNFGRRTDVSIDKIALDLRNATIATEDRNFYLNVGVDPIAVIRAVYYNVTEGSIVSGASTITQQVARNILLSPEERTERSLKRKVKEAVLAVELFRQYPKDEILEIYLNQIYYGNYAYGIEAASQTYFSKSANQLSLAESALLAGLPQGPALHDPYLNPEGAKSRQEVVLGLMLEAGYINQFELQAAKSEPVIENLKSVSTAFAAPHFVGLVRTELEANYPSNLIYQAGLRIETTLDQRLQQIAEEEVYNHVNFLANRNVSNGALVAIEANTGKILALVGSKDFRDEAIAGQINMAVSPRQPGSSIKPFVFLAAFEQGWTPSTLLMDVPVEYPDGAGGVYKPRNYDEKFHGPTTLRVALANSYNIPAIKTLEFVGIQDFKLLANEVGITTLTRNDYGLALSLGSGEVPLLEMTGAYQVIANGGVLIQPYAIARVFDAQGRDITPPRPAPKRVLAETDTYLMTNILADNEARSLSFGLNSYLHLSRPAAAKTGTTNDYRDNLLLGFTPDIVTGVWVGNADYTPMQGTTGHSGAGPIWHNFMERAHAGLPVRNFERPPGIVEIEVCADSGTIPSEVCPKKRMEIFAEDNPPLGPEYDIHQMIDIDLNSGQRANEFCRTNVETKYFRVFPPDGKEWAASQGIEQPPDAYCPSTAITAKINSPAEGETLQGTIDIRGHALAANFAHYQLEYGVGPDPQAFASIGEPYSDLVEGGLLGQWDTSKRDNGPYTIRLVVFDQSGGGLEARVQVIVDNPPTPTPTQTPTETPAPTATATPTSTPIPTATATNTAIPTNTLVPTNTPVPTNTTAPTNTVPPATATATGTPVVIPPTNTPQPQVSVTVPSLPTLNPTKPPRATVTIVPDQ